MSTSKEPVLWQAAEKGSKLWTVTKGKVAVMALLGMSAPWAANTNYKASVPNESANRVTAEVAVDQPVSVLQGGKAIVDLGNGKRVSIESPIVSENGTVMDRTSGDKADKQLVSPYDTSDTDADFDDANSITFSEGGRVITEGQALKDAVPEVLQVVNGALTVEGGPHAGDQVAVGQAEQLVHQTITKTVPDNQ